VLPLLSPPTQGVYLGFDNLRTFSGPYGSELYANWTDPNGATASEWSDTTGAISTYNTSLWQLGNDFITAGRCAGPAERARQLVALPEQLGVAVVCTAGCSPAALPPGRPPHREVFYWSGILKERINETRQWQFIQNNGPTALFFAYRTSFDGMALNTYNRLFDLHNALLVLLVVEALVVNLLALAYELVLLKNAGAQHMRCFAAFLALPSAMMRAMASKPCKVGPGAGAAGRQGCLHVHLDRAASQRQDGTERRGRL
jgi:hypothetical protein